MDLDVALSLAIPTASDHMLEKQQINRCVGEIGTWVDFFGYNKATGQMYKDGEEYVLAPNGTVSPHDAPLVCWSMQVSWGEGVEQQAVETNQADAGVATVGFHKEQGGDTRAATACEWG